MAVGESTTKHHEKIMNRVIDELSKRFHKAARTPDNVLEDKDKILQDHAGKIGFSVNVVLGIAKHHGIELRIEKLEQELNNPLPEQIRKQFRMNPDIMTNVVKEELKGA